MSAGRVGALKLRPGIAVAGAVAGVILVWQSATLLGVSPAAVVVTVAVAGAIYTVTAYAARDKRRTSPVGEAGRGMLLGMNSAMNVLLIFVLASLPIQSHAAEASAAAVDAVPRIATVTARADGSAASWGLAFMAVAAFALPFLSVFPRVSQSAVYRRVAGWLTTLLPMSWPVQGFGLLFLIGSVLPSVLTLGKVRFLAVEGIRVDSDTGSVFVKGGLPANLNYLRTAFNMGSFSFVYSSSRSWHIEHEGGHTLNLTAFGSVFHLAGAIDENIVPRRGADAYAERLAESNVPRPRRGTLPMWRPTPSVSAVPHSN